MSLLGSFDIGATGLTAQAMRLNVISSNIANVDSVSGPDGRAYRARQVVFSALPSTNSAGSGVAVTEIRESREPFRREYRPGHPKADTAGYVDMPNVNPVEEMVNMLSASRSYQMNLELMSNTRLLVTRTLSMGK